MLNVNDPKLVWQLRFEGAWPTAVSFVGSERRLLAGNRDGRVFVWELPAEVPQGDGKEAVPPSLGPVRELVGHANGVTRIVALGDGRTVVTASQDRTLRWWDVEAEPSGTAEVVLDAESRAAEAKKARNDEASKRPGVSVGTLEPVHTFEGFGDWVTGLGVSRDGSRLIAGDDGGRVVVFDAQTREEVVRWQGHPLDGVVSACLSPDGKVAFVGEFRSSRGSFDRPPAMARLFDATTGKELVDLIRVKFPEVKTVDTSYSYSTKWRKFTGRGFVASAFSPDGKQLAVGQGGETDTGEVHIVEVSSGKVLRTIGGHKGGMCDLAFSSDGKHLLTSGRDTTVRIVTVEEGKEIAVLGKDRGGQFKDWISALAITPDERLVAGADIAGMVHIWQLRGEDG